MPSKDREIMIKLPYGKPYHTIFADHFAIRKNKEMIDLDFHCERSKESITIRMSSDQISEMRNNLVEYLARLGPAESTAPQQSHFSPDRVLFADNVEMARRGVVAEFCFHAINWKPAFDLGKSSSDSTVNGNEAYYVASVRCSVEAQRHWIAYLYKDETLTEK